MTFAYMTIHPLKMDGAPRPGAPRGLPTGESDTDRYIHACGSDSFLRLDGRRSRARQLIEVMDYIHRHRKIHKFAGFEIHYGEIRSSHCVAAYRVVSYNEDGVSYQSLPKEKYAR